MSELETIITSVGLVAIVAAAARFFVKRWINGVDEKQDECLKRLDSLDVKLAQHDTSIRNYVDMSVNELRKESADTYLRKQEHDIITHHHREALVETKGAVKELGGKIDRLSDEIRRKM